MKSDKRKKEETAVKYQDELWIIPAHLDNGRTGMSSNILHSSCPRGLKTQKLAEASAYSLPFHAFVTVTAPLLHQRKTTAVKCVHLVCQDKQKNEHAYWVSELSVTINEMRRKSI